MVEVYSKMKPDTFQVTVATCLDRLIREDQEGCERQRLTKSWVVKRKFEDRTCARRLPRRPHRPPPRQRSHPSYPARRERGSLTRRGGSSSCPQPWEQGRGRQGGEGGRGWLKGWQGPGLMPIKLVC